MALFFFFNDTATTEIYTLSLHDALPIFGRAFRGRGLAVRPLASRRWTRKSGFVPSGRRPSPRFRIHLLEARGRTDRKSTRLNSSHGYISYAVFCLKKKKTTHKHLTQTAN